MSFSPDQYQTLSRLIKDELGLAQRMLEIMESEFTALRGDDPSAINSNSKEKLAHMQLMEQQLGRRNQFLNELGLPSDKPGTDIATGKAQQHGDLRSLWDELQSLATKLQKQNEINGAIVAFSQRHIRQALDILSGKENLSNTYSQKGETSFGKSSNVLAKA